MRQVNVSCIEGNRINQLLQAEHYLFEKNRNISIGISYCCLEYKTSSCSSRIHVTADGSFLTGEHTHPPKVEKIAARQILTEGKKMVTENRLITSAQILDKVENLAALANLQPFHLGKTDNFKRRIRYAKYKAHGGIDLGSSRAEIEIPIALTRTIGDSQFLLHDNHGGDNRMLIFATADSLDKLSYCETWLVDGTFKSCPPQFSQICTIHGIYRNSYSVPFVYAYLPGKDYECYLEFFGIVRRNVPGEPACIISDFELAAINACKETFIATELNGCLFHMTQNIFKHVQKNADVYRRYKLPDNEGIRVRSAIRSIGSLAFVRLPEVFHAFVEIRAKFPPGDQIREIFSFFQNNYLVEDWGDVRFPIPFWNVRAGFQNAQPRTNNAKEGRHYRFNSLHSKASPTMYTSISTIRSEEKHFAHECDKINNGFVPGRKRKSLAIDARLRNILQNHENHVYMNHSEFLEAIQHCLHDFLHE